MMTDTQHSSKSQQQQQQHQGHTTAAAAASMERDNDNESPVPSMTLSITPSDAFRVVEAAKALAHGVAVVEQEEQKQPASSDADNSSSSSDKKMKAASPANTASSPSPRDEAEDKNRTVNKCRSNRSGDNSSTRLCDLLLKASRSCKNPLIASFPQRMRAAGATRKEINAGILLFHDLGKTAKLKHFFEVLSHSDDDQTPSPSSPNNNVENAEEVNGSNSVTSATLPAASLNREGTISLFRSVVMSISICLYVEYVASTSNAHRMEKPSKVLKQSVLSPASVTGKSEDGAAIDFPTCQSPSFDSSMGTLRDEDERDHVAGLPPRVKEEIEEIASYAAERLLEFARKRTPKSKAATTITFDAFGDWYNFGGCAIVPWLELLDLSKWKPPSPSPPSFAARQPEKAMLPAVCERKSPRPRPPPISTDSSTHLPKFYSAPSPATRTVVSFDFTGASVGNSKIKLEEGDERTFCINITEANLIVLRDFVYRTGISIQPPAELCKTLLRYASKHTKLIARDAFHRFVRDNILTDSSSSPSMSKSPTTSRLSQSDRERYQKFFEDVFTCFAAVTEQPLADDHVNVTELAVGLSVLCAGSKSTKLAIGFELLDDDRCGSLSQVQLNQYVQSYLTMLVSVSLLKSSSLSSSSRDDDDDEGDPAGLPPSKEEREDMHTAVRNGSRWTLSHFLKSSSAMSEGGSVASAGQYSFEKFAEWYTSGGYNVAPWLELLDLTKLLSLIGDDPPPPMSAARPNGSSSGNNLSALRGAARHAQERKAAATGGLASPHSDVLFTFPLSNHRSLVVLRDDATYVRSVVEKLGLLSLSAEDVWSTLSTRVWQSNKSRKSDHHHHGNKSVEVDEQMFVRCMEDVVKTTSAGRKRKLTGSSESVRETLANFFHSFDLEQRGRVSLNELMGGLTLLCGGKKSTKLAFAFSVFDSNYDNTKPSGTGNLKSENNSCNASLHSLCGQEMFLFLRSFLIVMFSCCQQSLELNDDAVNRYINDTAGSVADDVMRFRNHSRKRDRVDFDDFGEWYNEGGFETAPWLELLDLKKWVLVDNFDALDTQHAARAPPGGAGNNTSLPPLSTPSASASRASRDHASGCPPAPPDEAIDHSFFAEDYQGIMPIDSMDDMDIILMQQPSQDKENDSFPKLTMSFSYSPDQRPSQSRDRHSNSLKFHVVTDDDHGGFMLSLSQKRIRHLRSILVESGLHNIDAESACHKIISKATPAPHKSAIRGGDPQLVLTKDDFDSAMRSIISGGTGKVHMSLETQQTLSDLLACIFTSFDRDQTGYTDAMEVACGFTVLCRGKKSDKLEFAFEVLDKDKDGMLSRSSMGNYLRSFLTVLLSIAVTSALDNDPSEDSMATMARVPCERTPDTVFGIVSGGAQWAASQAFKATAKLRNLGSDESISFDEFGDWYTNVGYSCIPWLELLDLRKWVIMDS